MNLWNQIYSRMSGRQVSVNFETKREAGKVAVRALSTENHTVNALPWISLEDVFLHAPDDVMFAQALLNSEQLQTQLALCQAINQDNTFLNNQPFDLSAIDIQWAQQRTAEWRRHKLTDYIQKREHVAMDRTQL